MRIDSAQISMTGSHDLHREYLREETLRFWRDTPTSFPADSLIPIATDQVSVSTQARNLATLSGNSSCPKAEIDHISEDPRLRTIRLVLEVLTGRKIRATTFKEPQATEVPTPSTPSDGGIPQPDRVGWGLEYDHSETQIEQEKMTFSAQGTVRTSDGGILKFEIHLATSREFTSSTELHLRAGDATLTDPLVMNLNGQSAELSDLTVAFDLNNDGNDEVLPQLKPGSGYLFLDLDNNGIATDGSELFGPATGDGLSELAHLDQDNNGWLDDNDPLFKKLKIWARDAAGNDSITSMATHNIGAILLDRQSTPFTLTGSNNVLRGRITDTTTFLREDGTPGTVQEIDLAV
ncbi:MAG: hypothetical protein KJ950_16280 [Proteobacteria bacterium]|nr:hypothetical protein [Pseudomonadota bacterium]MBU1685889.1 hypothetical protein [Pseudomonadota bacterium]